MADECPRFGIIQQDIPCTQPSSWNPGDCESYNVTVFDSLGEPVLNTSWFNYTPFCAFNVTGLDEPGTYCYNSSIEDGCITLERENNMLAIMIGIGMIIIFFFALGFFNQNIKIKLLTFGIGLIEIIVAFSLLYARELGNDISGLMRVNFYALLIVGFGVGMIALFYASLDHVDMTNYDDDKKWQGDNKWGR